MLHAFFDMMFRALFLTNGDRQKEWKKLWHPNLTNNGRLALPTLKRQQHSTKLNLAARRSRAARQWLRGDAKHRRPERSEFVIHLKKKNWKKFVPPPRTPQLTNWVVWRLQPWFVGRCVRGHDWQRHTTQIVNWGGAGGRHQNWYKNDIQNWHLFDSFWRSPLK